MCSITACVDLLNDHVETRNKLLWRRQFYGQGIRHYRHSYPMLSDRVDAIHVDPQEESKGNVIQTIAYPETNKSNFILVSNLFTMGCA